MFSIRNINGFYVSKRKSYEKAEFDPLPAD